MRKAINILPKYISIKEAARRILPAAVWQRLRGLAQRYRRTIKLDFGDLRRLTPVSNSFGVDRGLPVDRYYIEKFLAAHAQDIRGRVLEAGNDSYIRKYGGGDVIQADILDVFEGNSQATIIADLTCADHIPGDTFDCIILTQTLQMIYDVRAALRHIHRILKPGGVFLMTCHGISPICRREGVDNWGEYWHFTTQSVKRLYDDTFPSATVEITSYGNVFSATAFLYGLAAEELEPQELDYHDRRFELLVSARAVKSSGLS